MKLSLVVHTEGNNKGKVVEISLTQFLVGRDPQCNLRPASPLISKRHCALIKRAGRAYLQDFDSTNGTLLNDQVIKGEVQLRDGDVLKVGPLTFGIKLEATVPVEQPTPAAANSVAVAAAAAVGERAPEARSKKSSGPASDDEIAALLLGDDTGTAGPLAADKVPDGSTVMDLAAMQAKEAAAKDVDDKAQAQEKRKGTSGDTRSAAESILRKYMKRPRK